MNVFTAIADPTRRSILEILASSGQLTAGDIYDKFQVSSPAISQHLKILREVDLVQVEKHAQQRIYQINPSSIDELESWIQKMKQTWEGRFQKLDEILALEKTRLDNKREDFLKTKQKG